MNAVLTYNQESAVKAGGGDYITEGGAHVVTITNAKYITSQKGTSGLEFSVATQDGLKANFINVYYAKAPASPNAQGEPVAGGVSILNAMMGILRVNAITSKQDVKEWVCPEFIGKTIGLFLQKKLFTKNDGSDGYGFEIVVPYNPVDCKTVREIVDNKPPQTIERMSNNYKDRDERKIGNGSSGQSGFGGYDEYQQYSGGFGGQ